MHLLPIKALFAVAEEGELYADNKIIPKFSIFDPKNELAFQLKISSWKL